MPDDLPHRRFGDVVCRRILRDIADGHLMVWRSADGTDRADRLVIGAGQNWWLTLLDDGLLRPPVGAGSWTLTNAGRSRLAELNAAIG